MSDIVLNRAIERFRQGLTPEQRQLFTASSLDKLWAHIEQLVQVFLNVSEVVAFIWVTDVNFKLISPLPVKYANILLNRDLSNLPLWYAALMPTVGSFGY
ncbi:hypothetical protein PG994_004411 [Apiospora phragmitis]|uniref:Uncharacterized protein n=1 Tax=Apiospora phragmitis TaxID=2905665 RepID=A0ABR1VQR9_9PEZI